jgi:hypothetical protein
VTTATAPAAPKAVSQAEFARLIGVGRSYVTALKKAGRLVTDIEGRVLVEESKASLARSTGAPERAAVVTELYQDNRDKKDHYAAELARLDYEERCGSLMIAADVLTVVAGAATILRNRLETLPHILAPQLAVVSDEQQIMALLADQVETLLAELADEFGKLAKRTPE